MHAKLVALATGIFLGIVGAAIGAPSAGAQILSRGDAGPAVASWQDRLNDWLQIERTESGRLAVDGIYGPRTEAATQELQEAREIAVDGIVGPQTRSALAAALADDDSAGARPLLTTGDRGPAVATWQGKVNDWLRVNRPESGILAVDGIYGPRTEAATISFQRAQDIEVDGVVGPRTRSAYAQADVADSAVEPGTRPILVRGTRGDAVETWQQRLVETGAELAVDGIYGPNTAAATRSFQRDQDILVDGIVGPQTRAAMRDVEAR